MKTKKMNTITNMNMRDMMRNNKMAVMLVTVTTMMMMMMVMVNMTVMVRMTMHYCH